TFKAGAGETCLDAPRPAAETGRSGPLVVAGPWQRVVAPLPGDGIGSVEHLAVHDHARSDAGTENDAVHDVGTLARAVGRLRQREAVGVVGDEDFARKDRLEIAPDRLTVEADRVRPTQEAGRARNRSR